MVGAAIEVVQCVLLCVLLWVSGSSCLDDITCGELLKCNARTQYCALDIAMCSDCSGVCPGAHCRTYCPHYGRHAAVEAEPRHSPDILVPVLICAIAVLVCATVAAVLLHKRNKKRRARSGPQCYNNEDPATAGSAADEVSAGLMQQEGSKDSLHPGTSEVPEPATTTTAAPAASCNHINECAQLNAPDTQDNAPSAQEVNALDPRSRVAQVQAPSSQVCRPLYEDNVGPDEHHPVASATRSRSDVVHPSSSRYRSSLSQPGVSSTHGNSRVTQPCELPDELSLSLSSGPHLEEQRVAQDQGPLGKPDACDVQELQKIRENIEQSDHYAGNGHVILDVDSNDNASLTIPRNINVTSA